MSISHVAGWPLSAVQLGIWHAQQLHPGTAAYQVGVYLAIDGPARPDLLEAAARRAVADAETMRVRIVLVDGVPRQVPSDERDWPIDRVDLGTEPSPEAAAGAWVRAALSRPADPAGRLFAISLLRLSPSRTWLFLRADHLVMDGYSMVLFARRVARLYAAGLDGLPLGESGWGSPRTLVEEEAGYRDSADFVADRRYWIDRMAGRSATVGLAGRRGRTLVGTVRDEQPVAESLARRLRPCAERLGVTWPALVLAACAGYVHRATGRTDLVVGFPVFGRVTRAARAIPGMTANVVPLRLSVRPHTSLAELARQASDEIAAARRHQRYGHDELLRELRIDGGLCDISVNILPVEHRMPAGAHRATLHLLASGPTDDLQVGFYSTPAGNDPLICLDAHPEVYDRPDVVRHSDGVLGVLAALLTDAERPVRAVDVVTAGERRELSAIAGADGEVTGLLAAFEAQVARTPAAVAVLDGDREVSYAELDARAGRLSRVLVERGVRPETAVVVAMERSVDMVASLLAIWRAGGFFVPVDAHAPVARLRLILAESAAVVLLADRRPDGIDVPVVLPGRAPATSDVDDGGAGPAGVLAPAQLAYAIYTSGSTGRPKGVLVSHGAIANRVWWTVRHHHLSAADRVLQKTALGFDASLWEVFAPLVSGGVVVLAPAGAEHDPGTIVAAVNRHGVTVLQAVPSVHRMLVDTPGWAGCRSLRLVFSGGEPLPAALAHRLVAPTGARLWNTYGPTECAIDVTTHPFEPERAAGTVPIGRPIANTRVLVLTEDGELAPTGVAGELYAGGAGVARGYLANPALTADRFVPDPYGPPGARLYRTGDLVRRRAGGVLEYLGRLDDQVKVNGVRIEPGEIEAVLAEHPDVRGAVVLAIPDGSGGRRLGAYLTTERDVTARQVRAYLAERLPAPLVPSSVTFVAAFPLTSGGKVDRAALRGVCGGQAPTSPPRTPAERLVARIWSRLLGVDRVGPHDDFFQLGGSSMLVTQLANALRVETGRPVPFRRLFTLATVAEQAELIAGPEPARPEPVPPAWPAPRPSAGDAPAALSFGQYRLWVLDRMDPGSPEWVVPLILPLPAGADAADQERRVRDALRALADRHDVLRTRYLDGGTEPVQVVDPAGPVGLEVLDCPDSGVPDACAELLRRGFDLATGPVWRALLLRRPGGGARLVLAIHHIACDGWSAVLLERDFRHLYQRAGTGDAPEPPIRYADFAVWQRRVLGGDALDDQLAFWRRTLAGLPPLALPTDHPRPAKRDPSGALVAFTVPAEPAERLLRLGRAHGATPFMTLLAGFYALLSRYTGQTDIAVGTPVAGRPVPQVENVVGFFVNTVVLRCDLGAEPTFRELLDRVRATCRSAFAHQDLPFERLVDELHVRRDPSRTPLYQAGFDLDEEGLTSTALDPDGVASLGKAWRVAKTDLSLRMRRLDDGSLLGVLEYATALFAPDTAARLASYLSRLLAAVADQPDLAVRDVLAADEPDRLLPTPPHVAAPATADLVPDGAAATGRHEPPRNAVEERVVDLWQELLDVRVGVHDDFFALGGNSLVAMRMIARVRTAFDVDLSPTAFFVGPTVAELAEEVIRAITAEVAELSEAEVAGALGTTDTPEAAVRGELG